MATEAEKFLDEQPDGWLSQSPSTFQTNDDLPAEVLAPTERES